MKLVDSHCHLYLPEFAADLTDVIQRSENEGVSKFFMPAIDSTFTPALRAVESQFPDKCFSMTGLHPCSVKANYQEELQQVKESLEQRTFVALGEIGLDFYWDRTFESEQYEAFELQVQWAKSYQIPIVIHSRDSMKEAIQLIRRNQDGSLKGIFHCFNDSSESAKEIIDLGFHLGIGGVITYKNSKLPAALQEIGLEHLVLETDAPYLAPVPFRGKRNESAYLIYVARKLAEIKQTGVEEVADFTSKNAAKIFGC